MKRVFLVTFFIVTIMLLISDQAFAGRRPYRDAYGNAYSNPDNLWTDTDNDGYIGMYDRNDQNPNRW